MSSFKILKTTPKHGTVELLFDEDTIKLYYAGSWTLVAHKHGIYLRHSRNKISSIDGHKAFHRLALKAPMGTIVDHVNGNTLDNRLCNLRLAPGFTNWYNRRANKKNKSGYKGVHKFKDKWLAQIQKDKEKIYLGLFKTKEEAAEAYNVAAVEFFGEFAKLNEVIK